MGMLHINKQKNQTDIDVEFDNKHQQPQELIIESNIQDYIDKDGDNNLNQKKDIKQTDDTKDEQNQTQTQKISVITLTDQKKDFVAEKIETPQIVTTTQNCPSILDDKTLKAGPKLFQMAKNANEIPKFTPLGLDQLEKLLDEEPRLQTLRSSQGQFSSYESIKSIHQQGIPARLGQTQTNKELMWAMQFIIYCISLEKSEKKRKEALVELASKTEDCVPVTQRSVTNLSRKYQGLEDFPQSVQAFVDDEKDKAVDQAIYALFPDMQNPEYSPQHHHQQYMQFPHVKSGFILIMGQKYGLEMVGALTDPNANKKLQSKARDFEKRFEENFQIGQLIKHFIQDVNNVEELQIAKDAFMKWSYENQIKDIFYDESTLYPSYYPDKDKITEKHEMMCTPFIKEEIALQIFRKLQFIA